MMLSVGLVVGCSSSFNPPQDLGQAFDQARGGALLGSVHVVPRRPDAAGYDRSCGSGHGCVFGPAWSDDTEAEGGHNGCDTRNDILRRDLEDPVTRPGTHGCVVIAGTLLDLYTGATLRFVKAEAGKVQIDHVFPLAAAWDFGASRWSLDKRRAFANDPRNLLATSAAMNQSKGDRTPALWMPPRGQCRYAGAYLAVAVAYQLPVSKADRDALDRALQRCSGDERAVDVGAVGSR
jgi:hypothetical protein